MKLGTLIGTEDKTRVTGFAIDHRKVAKGTVFGAFRGAKFNGEDFIAAAVDAGAAAIVAAPGALVEGVPHIAADEPRQRFAALAARFYGPFPQMTAAITGTNGKTSTAELLRQLWRFAGHPAASIGTLGVTTAEGQVSTGLTTPDIVTFLSNMAGLQREGITHASFEASSHGLSQYRTEGLPVRLAAFTNLSRDHLDYHGTMAAYFNAKMRLFSDVVASDGTAVIWADDPKSAEVADIARSRGVRTLTVGRDGAFLRLVSQTPTHLGQTLEIEAEGRTHLLKLPLIGAYQAANALVAAGLALAGGDTLTQVLGNLARVVPVKGRLERVALSKTGAPIYVDYAHTPDAIAAACDALRPHTDARLHLVFGAGGDRDQGKRGPMGAIAREKADVRYVTDDNPRGEDPAIIRRTIMAEAGEALEIGDRREAIAAAIMAAAPGDVVLIAGKGHERGQIIGDRVMPFDDVAVAREEAS
ncbi:UDP-N-acetylmuramoyl-L-alanyl-D-glutamate--2,6-diaminopimelate ligase [Pacificimonas sp. WHA3]|uniref:UDP-N-acetylmuramoyl-L-alanyl-D-glutamate--2,6-diaminopimelate ligase n=1 Tax=Pacificimonas pallii TaxID=2827236 RepID=A0ABS6SFQ9_9SPHN|nr:UDP-N-acetylmuramoyl-L-alanyl-D-glutamate--2,6-diaminopimelate ligase [Pacificimonas pallii]MBV7257215.1 UDP-N-acetylmuramoyl-L-alanyl-D-glutamate--2,6-diaminopimelate ligase [Pacificimonas pallii]